MTTTTSTSHRTWACNAAATRLHKNMSAMIGSFQRTDPGPKFSFKHLYKLTRFFHEHHTFEGAPRP